MCEEQREEFKISTNVLNAITERIESLKVPCNYKGAFQKMARGRGFQNTDENFEQMQIIGETKSEVCILVFDGKQSGLIAAYELSVRLDTDKERAIVLQMIREKNLKVTRVNILDVILTVRGSAGGLFDE